MTDVHDPAAERAERIERRWAAVSIVLMALLIVLAAFAGIHQATMPQFAVETVDPQTLHISGEFIESNLGSSLEQDGSVTDMLFPVDDIIAYVTQFMTLEPGDLIATGTPPGVGPMQPGDTVQVEISGIGQLRNPVIRG